MSALTAGAPVVEVGFGVTSATGTTYGTKKWIGGFVDKSTAPGGVDVKVTTGSQDGEYYGDSGGPLFFQMPDATWRLVGEDWGSKNIDNTAPPRVSTYTSVPYHVAWAEQISGIDLTPCHDANGWNPTSACTGFPTNPGDGVGSWATLCQGETMSRQQTCQAVPPHADAGGELADAGADTSGRDGLTNGPGDADSRDGSSGDNQAESNGDSDTGRAYGTVDAANASDGRQMGTPTDGGQAGVDTHGPAADSPAGGTGSTGSDGGTADGSDGESQDDAGEGKASDSGGPGSTSDGGDASPTSDGGDARPGLGSDSGRDAGADLSAANDRGGSSVDGGVVHQVTRPFGIGCACRSVSDQDASSWPSFGLLGAALIAARLIRRRTRC